MNTIRNIRSIVIPMKLSERWVMNLHLKIKLIKLGNIILILNTKWNWRMVRRMDSECLPIKMAVSTKVNGNRIKCMEKATYSIPMDHLFTKALGTWIASMDMESCIMKSQYNSFNLMTTKIYPKYNPYGKVTKESSYLMLDTEEESWSWLTDRSLSDSSRIMRSRVMVDIIESMARL